MSIWDDCKLCEIGPEQLGKNELAIAWDQAVRRMVDGFGRAASLGKITFKGKGLYAPTPEEQTGPEIKTEESKRGPGGAVLLG